MPEVHYMAEDLRRRRPSRLGFHNVTHRIQKSVERRFLRPEIDAFRGQDVINVIWAFTSDGGVMVIVTVTVMVLESVMVTELNAWW